MCLLKSTGFLTQLLPQDTAKARNYIQLSPALLLEACFSFFSSGAHRAHRQCIIRLTTKSISLFPVLLLFFLAGKGEIPLEMIYKAQRWSRSGQMDEPSKAAVPPCEGLTSGCHAVRVQLLALALHLFIVRVPSTRGKDGWFSPPIA